MCLYQSILKEMNPSYSLEGLMLKLKLQYLGHLMRRADSLEKTLKLGKIEGRRRGWQRMRWLAEGEVGDRGCDGWMASPTCSCSWTWTWANSGRWWGTGKAWSAATHGVAKKSDMTWRLNNNNKKYTYTHTLKWRLKYILNMYSEVITPFLLYGKKWKSKKKLLRKLTKRNKWLKISIVYCYRSACWPKKRNSVGNAICPWGNKNTVHRSERTEVRTRPETTGVGTGCWTASYNGGGAWRQRGRWKWERRGGRSAKSHPRGLLEELISKKYILIWNLIGLPC